MSETVDSFRVPLLANSKDAIGQLEKATFELIGWYGDPMGSIDTSLSLDPNFTMGHVCKGVFELLGCFPVGESLKNRLTSAKSSLNSHSTWREKKHVEAFEEWSNGNMYNATNIWEEIIVEHPGDLLATKFAHDTYFYLGESNNIRDSIARIHPIWKAQYSNHKAYGYILSMYSFGLEETALYDRAETTAKQALEINPDDAWAVHTVAHVKEMLGLQREGIDWITSTSPNWSHCSGLAIHNYWHLCLYYLQLRQYNKVFDIYDKIMRKTHSTGILDLIDASSLLFRCEMLGVDVGDRWEELVPCWESYSEGRVLSFNDLHYLFTTLGAKKSNLTEKLMNSINDFALVSNHTQAAVTKHVGATLADAVVNWNGENYEKVVQCLLPVRHKIQSIGGSHAQRDLFNLLLTEASLRGKKANLSRSLVSERIEIKPTSPMNWSLYSRSLGLIGSNTEAEAALIKSQEIIRNELV